MTISLFKWEIEFRRKPTQSAQQITFTKPIELDSWLRERSHIEDVLMRRFHFFVLFYVLVVGGAINTKNAGDVGTILVLGTLICAAMAMTILRAHLRLKEVLDGTLYKVQLDSEVFGQFANAPAITQHPGWFSVRPLIGWIIPFGCCLTLAIGLFLLYIGYFDSRFGSSFLCPCGH